MASASSLSAHATVQSLRARMRRLRWLSYTLVVLGYILAYFHRMAPASIAPDLQRAFNASGAALGSLAAAYFYTSTLMQIPAGIMADTLGVRRVVAAGCLIAGLGSLMFAYAANLGMATLGRLIVGIGVSLMFISLMKLNADWFHERHYGSIGGLSLFLGNLGAVLAATPLTWLVAQTSWRNVFAGVAVYSLVIAALVWCWVRSHPGEAALPSMRELDGEPAHAAHTGHWFLGLKSVAKNPATWPGFWPNLGIGGSYFAFAGLWAVPYLRDVHGLDKAQAATYTSAVLIAFAVSCLVIGVLSDRMGRRRPAMLWALSLYLLCWIPMVANLPLSATALFAIFILMGVGASGFTLTWACVKEINPPALSGMATSVINTGAFLGAGILQPVVGWVMDRGWDGRLHEGARVYAPHNYQIGLLIMLIFAFTGWLGAWRIRETYCRNVLPGV